MLKANPKSGEVPAGFEEKLPVDQYALLYKLDVVYLLRIVPSTKFSDAKSRVHIIALIFCEIVLLKLLLQAANICFLKSYTNRSVVFKIQIFGIINIF